MDIVLKRPMDSSVLLRLPLATYWNKSQYISNKIWKKDLHGRQK